MAKVVLVACVATKADKPSPAEELYVSDLFKKNLAYAKKLTNDDNIYILSAKHHLLPLRKKIAPYDKTLKDFDADAKKDWSEKVIKQLQSKGYNLDIGSIIVNRHKRRSCCTVNLIVDAISPEHCQAI